MWFNDLPNGFLQVSFGDGDPKILSPEQQRELGLALIERKAISEYDVTGYDPGVRREKSHE